MMKLQDYSLWFLIPLAMLFGLALGAQLSFRNSWPWEVNLRVVDMGYCSETDTRVARFSNRGESVRAGTIEYELLPRTDRDPVSGQVRLDAGEIVYLQFSTEYYLLSATFPGAGLVGDIEREFCPPAEQSIYLD
jgi:hypothetical protein